NAGQPGLVVFFEQVSPKGGIPNKIIAGPIDTTPSLSTLTSADHLDLTIKCDPAADSCTFFYSLDDAPPTQFTTTVAASPKFPLVFFNTNAYGGILDSNQKNGKILPAPFVGDYQSFSITAP